MPQLSLTIMAEACKIPCRMFPNNRLIAVFYLLHPTTSCRKYHNRSLFRGQFTSQTPATFSR